jgi:hypothetical protein
LSHGISSKMLTYEEFYTVPFTCWWWASPLGRYHPCCFS